MKRIVTLTTMALLCLFLRSNENLIVRDVNYNWWSTPGNLSKAYITVEPKGLYALCEMVLVFDASTTPFDEGADLEAEMNFNLPAGSEIIDLWLWIEGEPIRGDILDKWTASLIYESIVLRRIDPAILVKTAANNFNIKVFPLRDNMPRKIKIQYLTPAAFSQNQLVDLPLPINVVNLSSETVEDFAVYFKSSKQFGEPKINHQTAMMFENLNHPEGDSMPGSLLSIDKTVSALSLTYKNKGENNYIGIYADKVSKENYYQLNIKPTELFKTKENKKALFVLDYLDSNCKELEKSQVLGSLNQALIENFSSTDSFNIILPTAEPLLGVNKWISVKDAITDSLLEKAPSFFKLYTNLPAQLSAAVDFLDENGGYGSIVLISSSNSHGDNKQANGLLTDLIKQIGSKDIHFHIINLDDNQYEWKDQHFFGGKYFSGNEYLLKYLSSLTGGDYFSITDSPLSNMINNCILKSSGYLKSMELLISTTDGYTYSNFNQKAKNGIFFFDESYTQTGKFMGEFPFEITAYGQMPSGQILKETIVLDEDEPATLDSTAKTIWECNNLKDMLTLDQSNLMIDQIINSSISNRILCSYTAFLVLEPGFEPDMEEINREIPTPEIDGEWLVSLDIKNTYSQNSLSNYPNPFSVSTTIKYSLDQDAEVLIKIFDLQGREVAIAVNEFQITGDYAIEFLRDNLNAGIYYYSLFINGQAIDQQKMIIY